MRDDLNVLGLVGRTNEDVVKDDDVGSTPAHLSVGQHFGEPHEEILSFFADVGLECAHQAFLLLDLVADSVA